MGEGGITGARPRLALTSIMISSTLLHPARAACAPGIGALHVLRARNCSWFGIHGWTRLALRDADARVADLGANANTGDLWPSSMTRLGCGLDRLMRAPQRVQLAALSEYVAPPGPRAGTRAGCVWQSPTDIIGGGSLSESYAKRGEVIIRSH